MKETPPRYIKARGNPTAKKAPAPMRCCLGVHCLQSVVHLWHRAVPLFDINAPTMAMAFAGMSCIIGSGFVLSATVLVLAMALVGLFS